MRFRCETRISMHVQSRRYCSNASVPTSESGLHDHIAKENNVLFVMAERLLTLAEQQQLASGFDEIEIQRMGAGTHERLHCMMDSLLVEVTAFSKN